MIWGEDILRRYAQRIYANSHKPSWRTLKRRLFSVGTQKKVSRGIKEIAESDKRDDFKQERMFGRVAKIPIANTFNELSEIDFVDYGDLVAFLHIQGAFSRFSAIVFGGRRRKKNKRLKW